MLKTIIINTLKILVAAGLIYWLVSSGKLDFQLLTKLKDHPLAVLMATLLSLLNFVIISFRWKTILKSRSQVTLPIMGLLKITWIGQFFSSVLPGSVSGDLVKMLYVQKFDPSFSKKFVLASILIDRVMGLCGLILLVGMSSLVFGSQISGHSPAMIPLLNFNYILMLLVVLSFLVFYFFHHWIRGFLERIQSIGLKEIFSKIINLWDDLVLIKHQMLQAIALSIGVQFVGVVIFWSLIQPFVENHMNFIQALAFIPIGLMTLALPVAPSGLGVGHAIFQKLFELTSITNGASLFNLYFVVCLVVNIFGVIPYITSKR
jgi:uncharacterized membrane protein YbhN (UPF0104 family)